MWTLWESPYGQKKVSLWEWLEWIQWESPYELRMSVPINLTWLISVRKSLCSVEWMSLSKWLGTTLWESPYESREVNPMEVTGMNPMRKSLSKWSESMRNEWIEVNRVNRGEMSDLKDLTWNPFKVTWVNSVGISLWVENECPYQSDLQTLSKWMESMRNEWIEVNRVKWVNWRIWLCEPYGKIPMVRTRCPYQSDLRWVIWSNPIKMIRFNEKWMNWSEMSEMKWNEWFDGNDLEQPYGNGPMVSWECPYGSDLMLVIWSNPIKMNGIDEKWMNWGE